MWGDWYFNKSMVGILLQCVGLSNHHILTLNIIFSTIPQLKLKKNQGAWPSFDTGLSPVGECDQEGSHGDSEEEQSYASDGGAEKQAEPGSLTASWS